MVDERPTHPEPADAAATLVAAVIEEEERRAEATVVPETPARRRRAPGRRQRRDVAARGGARRRCAHDRDHRASLGAIELFDNAVFNVLAPDIQDAIGVSDAVLGAIGGATGVLFVLGAIPMSSLSDRLPRKNLVAVTMVGLVA